MGDVHYFTRMHENDSIQRLFDAYEEEMRILEDIRSDSYYEDQGRQISVQRNHIEAIKILINEKKN